jgi:hypothetical protein
MKLPLVNLSWFDSGYSDVVEGPPCGRIPFIEKQLLRSSNVYWALALHEYMAGRTACINTLQEESKNV